MSRTTRSRAVELYAAIITGICAIAAAVISSPLWLSRVSTSAVVPPGQDRSTVEVDVHSAIAVIPGTTSATIDEVLGSIRAAAGLRRLMPLETGRAIRDAPARTYSFAAAAEIAAMLSGEHRAVERGLLAVRETVADYELHRSADGDHRVLGYISGDAAAALTYEAAPTRWTVVAPSAWQDLDHLVVLPVRRIGEARVRRIQTHDGGSLTVMDVLVR